MPTIVFHMFSIARFQTFDLYKSLSCLYFFKHALPVLGKVRVINIAKWSFFDGTEGAPIAAYSALCNGKRKKYPTCLLDVLT